jgi:hypothetical protein
MEEITDEIGVAPLLAKYRAIGGVLDYLFLKVGQESSSEPLHRTSQHAMPTGYQRAFFDPPYTLRGSAKEQAELFTEINRYVFGSEPLRPEMFAWSTDSSNYCDSGHEWWGAFYWTIRPTGAQYIVVIGATSSD